MPTFHFISATEPIDLAWLRRQEPCIRCEIIGELAERQGVDDLDLLFEALKDDHPRVQETAARLLIQVGGDTMAPRLVSMLREPPRIRNIVLEVIGQLLPGGLTTYLEALASHNPQVRQSVVDSFGTCDDPGLIAPLLPMLSDPSANVRAAAAEALGHLRAREAVPQLIHLLRDDQWVAFSAISALAEIGLGDAIEPLKEVVVGAEFASAYAALEAIEQLDHAGETLPFLLKFADGANRDLQPALVKTLMALAERRSTEIWTRLDRGRWVPRLNEILLADDSEVRCAAMTALGLLGEPSSAKTVLDMYGCLEAPSEEITDRAVQALVGIGNLQALLEASQAPEDERVAKVAIRALGVMGTPEAVPVLGQVLRSCTDWDRRRLAVSALGMIATDKAFEYLVEAVDDETGYVRREAAHILGSFRTESAVRTLITRLKHERYQEVRNEIGNALVNIGTPVVRAEVLQALQDRRPEVRETAAAAIGKGRWEEGLESLMEAMNDPDARVRRAVVEAIAKYFDAGVLRSLFMALSDSDEKVRLAALIGIGRWKTAEAREALLAQGLGDADIWVRYRAAELLGAHCVEAAVPALKDMIMSPHEPKLVKRAAIGALAAIGGTPAHAILCECLHLMDQDLRDAAVRALQLPDGFPSGQDGQGDDAWN